MPHRAAAVALSCRYWEMNDPFCCVHHSSDSQCFSVCWTTPQVAPVRGGSRPHLIHSFFGPQETATKRHLDRFSRFFFGTVHPCDGHTDRHTRDICSNRAHLMHWVHATWHKKVLKWSKRKREGRDRKRHQVNTHVRGRRWCGKNGQVPPKQFPLGHSPYPARLGLELGIELVGLW